MNRLHATTARSYLFVPGDRPDRFTKATTSGAERVIIDLEDAVAPEAKDSARASIAEWLATNEPAVPVIIRVNDITTSWHAEDLDLALHPGVAGMMLPKTENASSLAALGRRLQKDQELYALIETVTGFVHMREIAASDGLTRMGFGSVDFANDAGIHGKERELDLVRSQLVIESRYANLQAPIDGVTIAIDDDALLEADVSQAKRFGFGAKFCIHPRQVPVVQRGFAPSTEEKAWAARVLAAVASASHGAITVDGLFVDQPVIDRARSIAAYV